MYTAFASLALIAVLCAAVDLLFNPQQDLAGGVDHVMIKVDALHRLAGLEHELPRGSKKAPASKFVNLKPRAARILYRDASCIFQWVAPTCGAIRRSQATSIGNLFNCSKHLPRWDRKSASANSSRPANL
jgi:hypothetical protein